MATEPGFVLTVAKQSAGLRSTRQPCIVRLAGSPAITWARKLPCHRNARQGLGRTFGTGFSLQGRWQKNECRLRKRDNWQGILSGRPEPGTPPRPGRTAELCVRQLNERNLILTKTGPWDSLDVLEQHVRDPDFSERLRVFLRACSILLLPRLPVEAIEWVAAADEFEKGNLTEGEVTNVRVKAIRFHDARRESSPKSELSGLWAILYRLWPKHDIVHWDEAACHFLHLCEDAGLPQEQWWPLLRDAFPHLLQ